MTPDLSQSASTSESTQAQLRGAFGWTTSDGWHTADCASIRYPGSPVEPPDPCTCGGDRIAEVAAALASPPPAPDAASGREKGPAIGVLIDGAVYHADWRANAVDVDEFTDEFIDFCEARGWTFGGATTPIDEDGNRVTLPASHPQSADLPRSGEPE